MRPIQKSKEVAAKLHSGTFRLLISAVITGGLALFGWVLLETNSLGKTLVNKVEFAKHETENREDFKDVQETIREQQKDLVESIDEVKDLIIDLHKER